MKTLHRTHALIPFALAFTVVVAACSRSLLPAAPELAPYGTWPSALSAELATAGAAYLGQVAIDGEDVYWIESRPQEKGRLVVMRRAHGSAADVVTPAGYNVRSRVHEYGGGAYVVQDGVVYFSNFADNRLYRQAPGAEPQPLTNSEQRRFADCIVDAPRNRLVCVREDHSGQGGRVENTIVAVSLRERNDGRVLASGADFYSSPRLSPDGRRLAWLAWNHPNMPWDGTELWLADLDGAGRPGKARRVAGGVRESVFQPEWSPDGVLHFVSDRTGWWNLYRGVPGGVTPIAPGELEFGWPQWSFGMSSYAFAGPGHIVSSFARGGRRHLALIDRASGALTQVQTPYDPAPSLRASAGRAWYVGGAPDRPQAVVQVTLSTGTVEALHAVPDTPLAAADRSIPEAVTFPTDGGQAAHAFYYPPRNGAFIAPAGERPPLIVISHGGPTAATDPWFSPRYQFWTTRGFAVVDVNYGGSTGYGRAYRERLDGQWGIVDVADCINAARYLVSQGKADPKRLIIRGGSAGGYTTLAALTFHDVFSAGASYFGVSDAETLAAETHKFESRYLDRLIGPYPAQKARYRERSPINFVERLSRPMIFFQGLEDMVVPPAQSETMAAALRKKGIPVAYLAFPGEGHGFRQAATMVRTLEAELYFYGAVLGFKPAGAIEPVQIDNLPTTTNPDRP